MPAKSPEQQKIFGIALAVKRGDIPRSKASKAVLNIVDNMSEKEIEDFAATKHKDIKKESLIKKLIRKELKLYQNLKEDNQAELNDINDEIQAKQEQINDLNQRKSNIDNKIARLKEEISELKEEMNDIKNNQKNEKKNK